MDYAGKANQIQMSAKRIFVLCVWGVLCVTGLGAEYTAVVKDEFAGESIDSGVWESRITFSDSSVFAQNGNLVLINRGKLLTQRSMPTNIVIDAKFRFSGNQHDQFQLIWRSTGDDSNIQNPSRAVLNGIRLGAEQATSVNGNRGFLRLDWLNHPQGGGTLGEFGTNLLSNTFYDLRIEDDGLRVNVFLGTNSAPIISVETSKRYGDKLVLSNREGSAGGSSISAGSRSEVDHVRVWDRNLPIPCSPRVAKATPVIVNGFLVGATITDAGCGYVDAPVILVRGPDGQGASATAVVKNGAVSEILINNAGCCYTSAPRILIASPPFLPTLEIGVGKLKITQNVVLGRTYLLESSMDAIAWFPVGEAFAAESERIETLVDAEGDRKLFRIRQISE